MRALLHLASVALAAAAIYGGAPAHIASGPAHHSVSLADCPAGTNWNNIPQICQ
jgi:hypothetical protein